MRHRLLATFGPVMTACLCLLTVRTGAQQTFGTARVAGTVVSTSTPPQPVRAAVVTLNGAGANGRSVLTDDQGQFAFTGLPAGRFTITASKPAYLSNAYGAKAPGRPGTAVVIAADQSIAGLTLVLPRGAAIGGTLRDVNGEPAPLLPINVTRVDKSVAPQFEASLYGDAVTDDRGAYRVYGLEPGTYVVAATFRLASSFSQISVPSSAEIDAALREQQARASGAPTPPAPPAVKAPLRSYAPTYFPGTAVAAEATRITVTAGEDREGVDFGLAFVPVATIEGRVVSSGGPLPEMSVSLMTEPTPVPGLAPSVTAGVSRIGVNGTDTFRITNVAPGHYTLMARSSNTQTTLSPTGAMQSSRGVDPSTVTQLWGSTEVDVRGDDVTGVTLQLQPALTFSGRVVFNGSTPAPKNLTAVRMTLTSDGGATAVLDPLRFGIGSEDARSVSSTAKADGTFQLTGILPGRFRLVANAPGGASGWWLQSAMVGSRDVVDAGLELSSSASDVVLTFSDKHSEVAGVLQTGSGQPVADLVVVAFPADASLRSVTRRLQSARPATDGRFAFTDLPPGDYILAALTDDEDWQTPATLEQLAGVGQKVTIAEGTKITQNLKIAR